MGNVAEDVKNDRAARFVRAWQLATGQLDGLKLQLGTGATVPVSYAQSHARALFADALHRLVPDSTADLLTDNVFGLFPRRRATKDADLETWADIPAPADHPTEADVRVWSKRMSQVLEELPHAVTGETDAWDALLQLSDHVHGWQARYHLDDEWVHDAAMRTVFFADLFALRLPGDSPYSGPLAFFDSDVTVHDGLATGTGAFVSGGNAAELARTIPGLTLTEPHRQVHRPVYLDMLKHPVVEYDHGGSEDEGDFGTFDPRTETVDAAVKRLTTNLEMRLRRALQSIADEDVQLNEAIKPRTFTKATAFDWLVRYQVLGESRAAIAKADDIDRSQVSKKVNETGELIGLTLRKEKGGRPRNPRSNTKRVR